MTIPILGFTFGDPGGVGPEIVLKSVSVAVEKGRCIPVIFGSKDLLNHPVLNALNHLNFLTDYDRGTAKPGDAYFIDVGKLPEQMVIGSPNGQNGKLAFEYLERAIVYATNGRIDGLVTAPLCKSSFNLGDVPFTGHTSVLQKLTGSREVSMGFYTPRLKTVLATIHIPFSEIPSRLNADCLADALVNARRFSDLLGIKNPRIALAGLNPHAGEGGLFGDEDEQILKPFVDQNQFEDMSFTGPYPADTLYYRAYQGEFDMIISLYHDQGLIPVKLMGFGEAVNVTLGLPFVRTSVDHGTAFDIAYQGKASSSSLDTAVKLACDFVGKYEPQLL
jgi:4-phospho-D-threonate 3-dehydrogenase / 4-phospho-D-erythronate 3-dehydrogenase